jgi:L-amino acid N-acyltransferase YncA
MIETPAIRLATYDDLDAILRIYNQGIDDSLATLEVDRKSRSDIEEWWEEHDECYAVLVAVEAGPTVGARPPQRPLRRRRSHATIAWR